MAWSEDRHPAGPKRPATRTGSDQRDLVLHVLALQAGAADQPSPNALVGLDPRLQRLRRAEQHRHAVLLHGVPTKDPATRFRCNPG